MDTSGTVLVAVVESLEVTTGQVDGGEKRDAHPLVVFPDETVRSWFVVNQARLIRRGR
jgi:hypothetical protein